MSDTHHDLGNKSANITVTVDRCDFVPSQVNPNKMVATKEIPHHHLTEIMGVSCPDMLGIQGAHIEAIEPHRAEGLPTGAVLGMVAGTTKDGVFSPIMTDKTTSHVDSAGDTNIYTTTFSGRNGTPSHSRIEFKHPVDTTYADPVGAINKEERWKGVDAESAHEGFSMFTGTNVGGLMKQKAAVKSGSALHRLIEVNKNSAQFKKRVGEMRTISHSETAGEPPLDFTVIDAAKATSLADGLKDALTLKGPVVGQGATTIKLITDKDVVDASSCPISTSFTLHRADGTKEVPRGSSAGVTAALAASTDMEPGVSSLAARVFEDEQNVVKIEESAGSD